MSMENQLIIFLTLFLSFSLCYGLSPAATSGLLQTQDGYIINSDGLHGSEEDIRLEDFFWTGSGDGSPGYLRKPNMAVSESDGYGKGTIIKTATVVATVYIDSNLDSNVDPLCIYDCPDAVTYPADYSVTDRRYWLLTIVAGYLQPQDFPIIEQKLATLYRIAFSRQQSWHLGIGNNTIQNHVKKRKRSLNINSISTKKILEYQNHITSKYANSINNITNTSNRRIMAKHYRNKRDISNNASTAEPISQAKKQLKTTIAATKTFSSLENEYGSSSYNSDDDSHHNTNNNDEKEEYKIVRRKKIDEDIDVRYNGQRVSVLVHNISVINDTGHEYDGGYANVSKDGKSFNHTEIIYSVFVGGKPVLAATAAEDMKLVSQTEVAQVMEKVIYTKAEPYMREPLATPLIPESSQNSNLVAVFTQNPIMFGIVAVMILLIVILLVGFLLMTRAKKRRSAEIKRLTARKALIDEDAARNSNENMQVLKSESDDEGIVNLSYERDPEAHEKDQKTAKRTGAAILHFPHPPTSSPSSSTSDSSVYYPKRRSRLDIQNILDEKTVNFFKKKSKALDHLNQMDAVDSAYATVVKKKDRKLKTKRKYLSENRVGSIESAQIHRSESSSGSDLAFDSTAKMSHYYEHIETFNPNVSKNYHKNKLLTDTSFTQKLSEDDGLESPSETYNKEILTALQKHNQSPGSGSIGSFLSMASVRSFPKCTVPEPLSRVLEPVSVTHLDHTDDTDASYKKPRIVDASYKCHTDRNERLSKHFDGEPNDPQLIRSQSDGADPGVIGPGAWKFQMMEQNETSISPLRDPVKTRNRFEGLLEGAIKLYSNGIMKSPADNDVPGAIRFSKDPRGKSAVVTRQNSILPRSSSGIINRPVTAGPTSTKNEYSTEPPSPYKRAWGSGAPSPLVRPLSAGPFHRPEAPLVDVTRVLAPKNINSSALSTAPLIEAIQNELKKFNSESHA